MAETLFDRINRTIGSADADVGRGLGSTLARQTADAVSPPGSVSQSLYKKLESLPNEDEQLKYLQDMTGTWARMSQAPVPGNMAIASELSDAMGVPLSVAIGAQDTLKQKKLQDDLGAQDTPDSLFQVLKEAPEAAPAFSPDVGNLQSLMAYMGQQRHLYGTGDETRWEAIKRAYGRGAAVAEMSELFDVYSSSLGNGADIPEWATDRMKDIKYRASAGAPDFGFFSEMAEATSEVLPQLVDSAEYLATGAAVGALAGSAGGVPGAIAGAGYGAMGGGAVYTYRLTYVDMVDQLMDIRVDDQPIPRDIVNVGAKGAATLTAALEVAPWGMLASRFPFLKGKDVVKGIVSNATVAAARNPEVAKAVMKALGDLALFTAAEGVTEGSQELVAVAVEELAKAAAFDDYEMDVFSPETRTRIAAAAAKGAMGAPLIGLPGVGLGTTVQFAIEKQERIQDRKDQEHLDTLIDATSSMNASSAVPQQTADVITGMAQQTGAPHKVYVDASAVVDAAGALHQDGKAPGRGTWFDKVLEKAQESLDGSVELDVGDVAVNAGGAGFESLRPHMRLRPDGVSQSDMNRTYASRDATLEERLEVLEKSAEVEAALKSHIDQFSQELAGTGRVTKRLANTMTRFLKPWLSRVALLTGENPVEVLNKLQVALSGDWAKQLPDGVKGMYTGEGVVLGEAQDLSTFLHEYSHFMFDVESGMGTLSHLGEAFAKVTGHTPEAIEAVLTGQDKASRAYRDVQEGFATGFERYLGNAAKAPALLGDSYSIAREWLQQVYAGTEFLKVNNDPALDAMFGEMLGLSNDIEAMYKELGYDALATQVISRKARAPRGSSTLVGRIQKWLHKERRKALQLVASEAKEQVQSAVEADTGYQQLLRLREQKVSLNIPPPSKDHPLHMVYSPDGMTVDELYDLVGGEGGTASLYDRLINAKSPKGHYKDLMHKGMITEAKVLTNDEIKLKAMELVRTPEVAKALLSEARRLSRNKDDLLNASFLKAAAIRKIMTMPIKDLSVAKLHRLELRAAEAYANAAEGSKEKADLAKQRAILRQMVVLVSKYTKQVQSAAKRLKKYNRAKYRAQVMNAGGSYWPRLAVLLNRAGLLKDELVEGADKVLNAWLEERDADGIAPPTNTILAGVKNYKDLTLGDFLAMRDTADMLIHSAKTAKSILLNEENANLDQVAESIVQEVIASPMPDIPERRKGADWFQEFMASLSTVPWLVRRIVGNDAKQSVLERAVYGPMRMAGVARDKLFRRVVKPLIADMHADHGWYKFLKGTYTLKTKIKGSSLPETMTGSQVIGFVLNIGNYENLTKLLQGYGLLAEGESATLMHPVVQEIMGLLGEQEWKHVSAIWKHMQMLFQPLREVTRKVYGRDLQPVDGLRIETPHGPVTGGYYPLVMDRDAAGADVLSRFESTEALMNGGQTPGMLVRPSAAYERTNAIYPVLLDASVIFSHFNRVIHYISHTDAVDSVRKVLADERVHGALLKKAGKHEVKYLGSWLKDIASDKRMEQITWLEQLIQRLRYGVVVVALGAKVFTSVPKQLLGLYNTAIDLKSVGGSSGALLKAFAELIRSPRQVVRGIRGESPVMLSRIDTYDREIAEALSYMEGENPRLIRWNEAVMLPIRVMQFYVVDIPSYITAKALAIKNGNSEQDAIAYAEAFVTRTQGSGEARDLAFIMRRQRNVMLRTLTMFMTPMIS
ncbi:hypothetical protein, partial [Thiolapillus sp.]|uniref:hypothetical protein n=1 Tax=Thiolapillus sp. TaxID=2017437 RepID=UPI003AF851F4